MCVKKVWLCKKCYTVRAKFGNTMCVGLILPIVITDIHPMGIVRGD